MAQRSAYGGQAVIEGVMIRGKDRIVTACRRKDGRIIVRRDDADSLTQRYPWMRLAFLRGTPALIDSMRLGYRTLMWSADVAMEGEEQQEKPSPLMLVLTTIASLAIGIGGFVLFPTYAMRWVFPHAEAAAAAQGSAQFIFSMQALLHNFGEGLLRIIMLVGYISLIGRMKDIRRVFAYHGAEHKVVNAWEGSATLSVESAKGYSRIHPRCGTSFLFLVFFAGILLHALIGWPVAWVRVVTRLLMLPLVAGTAYELIRLSGRYRDSRLLKVLIWPGLWLQRLTTAEPSDDQIEVAVHSLRTVLEDEGVVAPEPKATPIAPSTDTEHVTT